MGRKVSNIYGKTAERLTGDTELSAYIRSVTELKVEAPTPGHVAKVEGSHKWITKKKLKLARSTTTKPKGKAKKPSKKPRAKKTNFKKAKLSDGKKPKQAKPKAKKRTRTKSFVKRRQSSNNADATLGRSQ